MNIERTRSTALTANIDAVLDRVAAVGTISRVELASDLGITKSSISDTVRFLESVGIIAAAVPIDAGKSVGRPRQAVQMADAAGVVAGIQAEGDYYIGVLKNFRGETVHRHVAPLAAPSQPLPRRLTLAVQELLSGCPRPIKLRGVGLGLPGIIDFHSGTVRFSYSFGIENAVQLAPELAEMVGVPVAVENDANCCAYGTLRSLNLAADSSFLYVLVDFLDEQRYTPRDRAAIGIGLSFVFNGQLWRGAGSSAGEFRSFRRESGESRQLHLPRNLEAAIRDDWAVQEQVIGDIAENVAYISTMSDITTVVIAGDICTYEELFRARLAVYHRQLWMYPIARDIAIVPDDHHEYSVADGASVLIQDLVLRRTAQPDYVIESLIDQVTP